MNIKYMTQKENIKIAIEHLLEAIDTFPDKDDKIRLTNDALYGMIATLKMFIGDNNYD